MGEKIKIGEIKRALEHNRRLSKKDEEGYEKEEKEWQQNGVYDSSLERFGDSFTITLPESLKEEERRDERGFLKNPKIFQRYIEQTLSREKKQDLTAVEFGGSGSQLFRGFTKDFFRKTAAVCLKDIRNQNQKNDDVKNNHSVIEGDIMDVQDNQLLTEVAQKLGTKKSDLIISRMFGLLKFIDRHPAILDRIIRKWYDMLNENGLMFVQFEPYGLLPEHLKTREYIVKKWSDVIKEKFLEIDIQIQIDEKMGVLRLHKKFGAPKELPSAAQLFK